MLSQTVRRCENQAPYTVACARFSLVAQQETERGARGGEGLQGRGGTERIGRACCTRFG